MFSPATDAKMMSGDAVDVARLQEESAVSWRSHGSLSLNRALMAAGLVDRVQTTLFPVVTGKTGTDPIFGGAADFDLELVESRTPDRHTHIGLSANCVCKDITHRPITGTGAAARSRAWAS
jgi:dihydrofolate reductase